VGQGNQQHSDHVAGHRSGQAGSVDATVGTRSFGRGCCGRPGNTRPSMAAAAHRSGHVLDVLIDVDLGMGRTGISNIESALQLVNVVCDAEGISYRGIQGVLRTGAAYPGVLQERDHVYTGQLRFPLGVDCSAGQARAEACNRERWRHGYAGTRLPRRHPDRASGGVATSSWTVEYGAVTLRANDADAEFATSLVSPQYGDQ